MKSIHSQRGITLIGLVMLLALVIFAVFIGMKLFPVYSEYYSVAQAMEQIKKQPGVAQYSPAELRSTFEKRLYISYVESVKKKDVKISRSNGYKMRVKYEVRRSLIGNLDYVAKFEKTIELTGKG